MSNENKRTTSEAVVEAARILADNLYSPNLCGANGDAANIVDAIADSASQLRRLASAITPQNASGGRDSYGGKVESLTEAVMGATSGLHDIADAIRELAQSVKGIRDDES